MKKVELISYRSDGEVFEYESGDWRITGLDGLDFPTVEISQKPQGLGHGSIITGKRKHSRDIIIKARSQDAGKNEIDRARALAFHNSNYTYDLKIEYMGQIRYALDCELEAAKCGSANVYTALELTVNYLSPEADLFGATTENTIFKNTAPLWHWTRVYTEGGSLAFGVTEITTSKVIYYTGSEPAPLVVTVVANGYVPGLVISCRGVVITLNEAMVSGDRMVIDAGENIIRKNGVKVAEKKYNAVDLIKLNIQFGDNVVEVKSTAAGNTAFETDVQFIGRYGGI